MFSLKYLFVISECIFHCIEFGINIVFTNELKRLFTINCRTTGQMFLFRIKVGFVYHSQCSMMQIGCIIQLGLFENTSLYI